MSAVSISAKLIGGFRLKRQLDNLGGKGAKKAIRAGAGRTLTVMAKGIRQEVPSKYKSIRKTVGKKYKDKEGHELIAKVGFGVGKRTKPDRDPKRPGVGMSKHNIHWFVLGTKNRQGPRGAMPEGPNWVPDAVASTKRKALKEGREKMRQVIAKESRKR